MTPQTILVTGGAGFIGSHVCRMLLSQGHRVVVMDDFNDFYDPAIKHANLAPFSDQTDRFFLHAGDIRDPKAMAEVFAQWGSQLNQVIHLAARAGVRPSLLEPQLYLDTNVTGTLHLLEAMRQYGVPKIVFASSSSVYGNRKDPPFREDQDVSRPISPYAASKVMAEHLLYTYHHLYDIQVVILRFFTVYGPAQRPDLAIHQFTHRIASGQPIRVYGNGDTMRDYTYIDDILQGIHGALGYHTEPFDIFNLGESQPIALKRLIMLLEDALGQKAVLEPHPMQPGDVWMTCADISKACAHLGYHPQTPIEQGLLQFVDWYRQTAPKPGLVS